MKLLAFLPCIQQIFQIVKHEQEFKLLFTKNFLQQIFSFPIFDLQILSAGIMHDFTYKLLFELGVSIFTFAVDVDAPTIEFVSFLHKVDSGHS
jgi:hypothetical protein